MNDWLGKHYAIAVASGVLLCASCVLPVHAVEFSGSGFLTLAAGRIFAGTAPQSFNGYDAPLYVSDFAQSGIYESGGWSLKPDSRIGYQGTIHVSPQLWLTAQVVARGVDNAKGSVEWGYVSYALTDKVTVQAGRKRLPLLSHSETQDVGLSYPWTHLPPQTYGWEVVNYNGINALWRADWGGWNAVSNVFAGEETRRDNGYWKIYNGRATRTDSRWSNMVGADLTLTREWLELRLSALQASVQTTDPAASDTAAFGSSARMRVISAGVRTEWQSWVAGMEVIQLDTPDVGETEDAYTLMLGYRLGKWLPMVTLSSYQQTLGTRSELPLSANEAHTTVSVGARYDLSTSSALKAQWTRWMDRNGALFNRDGTGTGFGHSNLITVSYDLAF